MFPDLQMSNKEMLSSFIPFTDGRTEMEKQNMTKTKDVSRSGAIIPYLIFLL